MSLQDSFSTFNTFFKKHNIKTQNKFLQEILNKFDFYFINDIKTEDEILQGQNESKIIIIDEYQEKNGNNFFFICFDYIVKIINQNQKILNKFLSKQHDSEKYYLKQELNTEANIFAHEIENFSKKFEIINSEFQKFWELIVNCISGFLIKKSYKNHKNKNDEKTNKKFLEGKKKLNFIKLREIGQGDLASVYLVYYIKKEELFALKSPYNNTQHYIELIERERLNYLNIEYPYIVKYIGYVEHEKRKCLLLEFVEGKTLDQYEVKKLNNVEKYNIIFELLLTIQYIHSLEYIYRDIHFSNIMINTNKDVILIDFDRVIKIEEQQTFDFYQLQLPELDNEGKLDYKSDVCSIARVMFFILTGVKLKLRDKQNKDEEFIYDLSKFNLKEEEENLLKQCFYIAVDKRISINQLIIAFFNNYLSKVYYQSKKEPKILDLYGKNSLIIKDNNIFCNLGDFYY